jgi:hypothetical protein
LRLAFGVRVFDHNAHAVFPIVVVDIAHNPDAGMVHLDDRRDTFGGAEPQHRHVRLPRHRIAIQRDHSENVAGSARLRISPALALST